MRAKIVSKLLFHKSCSRAHFLSDVTTQHVYQKLRNNVNICQTVNQKPNELHGLLYIIFNSSVYYLAVEPNEWKRKNKK